MMTIIYYTDNVLEEPIKTKCREHLVKTAEDVPIISVSQKPIKLGKNICVGEIGSNWLNLYKQLLIGLENATTKYVAMAEHDCLYSSEHFKWTPPRDDTFYYNENNWLVQWGGNHPELNGMYSQYWGQRLALSQLVCNRKLLLDTINARLNILDKDRKLVRKTVFIGEPGLSKLRQAQRLAESGRPVHLQGFLKKQLDAEKYDTFKTKIPNLDIRHGNNFTGPKRGRNRTYDLKPWGKFKDIIC